MSKFKVGQPVWSIQYGWGTVVRTDLEGPYKILATFNEVVKDEDTYTPEGFLLRTHKIPDLYHQEMGLVPKPLPLPPKGTPILVRDELYEPWCLRIFQKPLRKGVVASSSVTDAGVAVIGVGWRYWKPYEVPHDSN